MSILCEVIPRSRVDVQQDTVQWKTEVNMLRVAISIMLLSVCAIGNADTGGLKTTVSQTLSDADNFGGCMALLETQPATIGLDCKDGWVTFSCTGDFADRSAASRNFDSAQLAMLTETEVYVVIDDSQKHNGRCFASRVAMIK